VIRRIAQNVSIVMTQEHLLYWHWQPFNLCPECHPFVFDENHL